MTNFEKLSKYLDGASIKQNFDISSCVTLRTKTRTQYFFEATSRKDLIDAKKAATALDIPFFVLGGGSNLAITKARIDGLVVQNRYIEREVIDKNEKFVLLKVSSGYPSTLLARETAQDGYGGLQYHLGLPGTVGGALFMNSKWTHPTSYFGDFLEYAFLLDNSGKVKKVSRDYFEFAYDTSILQKTAEILLEAVFKLKISDPEKLLQEAKDAIEYRKKTQPFGVFSSGCFFRNINGKSAGQLIDKSGLKGINVGNFYVSPVHANFIINKGNGDPTDLVKLISHIKVRVKNKFGLKLKEEVILI